MPNPPKRKRQHSRHQSGGQQKGGAHSIKSPKLAAKKGKTPPSTAKKAAAIDDVDEDDMADVEEQDFVDGFFEKVDKMVDDAGILPRQGAVFDAGMTLMVVRMVYKMAKTRAGRGTLRALSDDSFYPDMAPIYRHIAGLTGSASETVKQCFEDFVENGQIMIEDTAHRGSGSPNVNKEDFRLRTREQYTAIEAFVDYCNTEAGGKVTLEQIQLYMQHGPRPESDDPKLPEGCERVLIPRTSPRCLLNEHLGYKFGYKTKKAHLMKPKARHARIWKFAIEMSRALKMQATGDWAVVFTDESYVNQNHAPLTTWLAEGKGASTPSGKGKRLVIVHAISTDDFVCEYLDTGVGVSESGFQQKREQANTAEWVWQAKSSGDYHDNMDGDEFEWWLENRLIPAFQAKFGDDKNMILVMDNASYHHQLNPEYYPKDINPSNCSKAWHAHVLRKAGCTSLTIPREGGNLVLSVPAVEPEAQRAHREGDEAAPKGGATGTVYKMGGTTGATARELYAATVDWLKTNKPDALDSKVERMFREKDWRIIWTPPYAPRFQPIELIWGVAKQRITWSYSGKRTLRQTHDQLRVGFYGGTIGTGHHKHTYEKANVAGCWETAKKELNLWISKDAAHNQNGLTGTLDNLGGVSHWTQTADDCLDIQDMDLEVDDDEEGN